LARTEKIKTIFAAFSCLLTDVNFLHYAKFMHFNAAFQQLQFT